MSGNTELLNRFCFCKRVMPSATTTVVFDQSCTLRSDDSRFRLNLPYPGGSDR
jgi:hypothetical protein